MFLLGCEKVSVEFPTKRVFEGISLGVNTGDRIGIVGRNGDGKSTLLRLLAGEQEPDEGRVLTSRGATVGLLAQQPSFDPGLTVGRAVVGDTPEYEWASNARTRAIIAGLLADVAWDAPLDELSGGQRRRVDLARLLVGDWDILALDEPTNHLDIRAINWLANHLKTRWNQGGGALLVVTHDRWFLDEVCLQMWEVHHGRVEPFEGGFSAYILQRVERERQAAIAEQKRQNQLRRELAWLSRGARARATKPKFHVATAQALIADVPPLRDTLELKRMALSRLGKDVIDVDDVAVGYEGQCIASDITWHIGAGDRYGIVGANGAGKTTLLNVLQGLQPPVRGRVKIGKTVRFAFLSQNLEMFDGCETDRVREVISRYPRRTMLDGKETTPGQLLERLGFSRADQNERVGDLSGGQRRRLALMLVLLDEPNVLVLDEPGNDLDIDMLAAVEDVLDGWPGTLLLVTHDRYLMERVTDDQFAIIGGRLRHLPRGIDEYLELAAAEDADAAAGGAVSRIVQSAGASGDGISGQPQPDAGRSETDPSGGRPRAAALSGAEFKALKKTLASAERRLATLRGKQDAVRDQMAAADPTDFVALHDFQLQLDALQAEVDQLEMEWLEAAEALGE